MCIVKEGYQKAFYSVFQTDSILNRIHVAEPKPRDTKSRPAFIPEAALKRKMKKMEIADDDEEEEEDDMMDTGFETSNKNNKKKNKKKTERDIELEMGDDYVLDLNKKFDLPEVRKVKCLKVM